MDTTHPLGMETSQVIVHSDDVDTLARQTIQIGRQCRHERLAFTSFHFGNPTEVQSSSTHQLHIEVALTNHS